MKPFQIGYSLQDASGHCLHAASYRINRSTRRCIDAGDGKRCCGYQFEPSEEWRAAQRAARKQAKGEQMNTIEQPIEPLSLDELRLAKQACTLAIDELRRRKQPHTELIDKLDALYQRLRSLGA